MLFGVVMTEGIDYFLNFTTDCPEVLFEFAVVFWEINKSHVAGSIGLFFATHFQQPINHVFQLKVISPLCPAILIMTANRVKWQTDSP